MFRGCKWPHNIKVEVIEYDRYLAVRLHRTNFEKATAPDHIRLIDEVGKFINTVRAMQVPCYLEVV